MNNTDGMDVVIFNDWYKVRRGAVIRQQPHKSMILIGMDNTDLIYLRLRYISEYVLDILDEQIIRLILFLWEHMLRQG